MNIQDLLLADLDLESSLSRRILAAVPDGIADFKPHDRSMPLGRLAMHVATVPALGAMILTTPSCDAATATFPDQTFHSAPQLLTDFDRYTAAARAALLNSTQQDLEQPWQFGVGAFIFSNEARASTFRHMYLAHMIHHRAQLGVYLRLNDLPVPGIYGPSADDKPPS